MVNDFDADGRSDRYELRPGEGIFVSLSNGKSFSAGSLWYPDTDWTVARFYAGDFDGDGRTDLVRTSLGGVEVLLSDGDKFLPPINWSADTGIAGDAALTGDFDGDGRADLLSARPDGTGVNVMLSTGGGFGPQVGWADADVTDFANWAVGDFNGDGKDDIVRKIDGSFGAEILLSNGTGFTLSPGWTNAGLLQGENWIVGDFNGDGKADLLRSVPFQLDSDVFLSNGKSLYKAGTWNVTSNIDLRSASAIDLNGDGLSDILVNGGLTLLNTGNSFVATFPDERFAPSQVLIPKVVATGGAIVLNIDHGERYSLVVVDASTGEAVRRVSSIADGYRLEIGDGFNPGSFYTVRLTSTENPQLSYSTPFKIISANAADEMLSLLDRFEVTYHENTAGKYFSGESWKAGITSFQELGDLFASKSTLELNPQLGRYGAEGAKALFLMQSANLMWSYGNPIESTLPGRVINNEQFVATDRSQINFNLYLHSQIADCQDYAALTAYLLTREGIENRIVLTTGHVFNEAKIDGEWWSFDATMGVAYQASYEDVLAGQKNIRTLDFGRGSSQRGLDTYRDVTGDFYNQTLLFDGAGVASQPQYLSVLDFYNYLYDGFIYREALPDGALAPTFSPTPIATTFLPPDVDFGDFYNYLADLSRFSLSYASPPAAAFVDGLATTRALHGLTYDLQANLARAGLSDADLTPGNALERVLFITQYANVKWRHEIGEQSTATYFDAALRDASSDDRLAGLLASQFSSSGFDVRIIESHGATFLELAGEKATYVVDPRLGIVYVGRFDDVLSSNKVATIIVANPELYVETTTDDHLRSALSSEMKTNLLKFQVGYYGDYSSRSLSDWLYARAGGDLAHDHTRLSSQGSISADNLLGGDGSDSLSDRLGGDDTLRGGNGDDVIQVSRQMEAADSYIIIDGGAGRDHLRFSGAGRTRDDVQIVGGDGDDSIEVQDANTVRIDGGAGDDSISLSSDIGATAAIDSGAGKDLIYLTGSGSVTVTAGDGGDSLWITQGAGTIRITLGKGEDRITLLPTVIQEGFSLGTAPTITDFTPGQGGDVLDLSRFLKHAAPGWDGSNPFSSGYLKLAQVGGNTEVRIDQDGGGDGFKTIAIFENVAADQLNPLNLAGLVLGDTVTGTAVADDLIGTALADILSGLDGNDRLRGGMGADLMIGGPGNDIYEVDNVGDVIIERLGEGYDTILSTSRFFSLEAASNVEALIFTGIGDFTGIGNEGGNELRGGDSDDTLIGNGGSDTLEGGRGNNLLDGGEGFDTAVVGYARSAVSVSYEGRDIIIDNGQSRERMRNIERVQFLDALCEVRSDGHLAANLPQILSGTASDDYLVGGDAADTIYGGDGADAVFGGFGADTLYGDDGRDYLDGGQDNDILIGGLGGDIIIGRDGDDYANGGGDDDYLNGGGGNDVLVGEDGSDHLFGEDGADTLQGGDGVDWLDGGAGGDVLYGGAGGDVLLGRQGDDYLVGGDGDDYVNGGDDIDVLLGQDGNDVLVGGDGNDYLYGGSGADNLQGGAGGDILMGDEDGDILYGQDGDDALFGGDGDDYLVGGTGDDLLSGGSGSDIFVIGAGEGNDRIVDFNGAAERDTIRLTGFGWSSIADVQAHSTQNGTDTVIQLAAEQTLSIANVALTSLAAASFQFG
jgi:Ca2+-binding RTX toxin-like protein